MTHHSAALRAFLEGEFERLTRDVTRAEHVPIIVERLLQDLVSESKQILLQLTSAWNLQRAVHCLPDELLAMCFAFLPLRDRLSATRVSRAWRQTALAFPQVWSRVDLSYELKHPAAAFELAVARAGQLGIDLSCVVYSGEHPMRSSAVVQAVEKHIHRLRSIDWTAGLWSDSPHFLGFQHAAPLLESIVTDIDFHISEDFLSGRIGNLLTLGLPTIRLPTRCPALATVTHLSGAIPSPEGDVDLISPIFELCPRLQTLSLQGLRNGHVRNIGHRRAPASLRRLTLADYGRELIFGDACDLAAFCVAWRAAGTADIELFFSRMPSNPSETALAVLFGEAVAMVVCANKPGTQSGITIWDAGDRRCHLDFAKIVSGRRLTRHVRNYHYETFVRSLSLNALDSLTIDDELLTCMGKLPSGISHLTIHFHGVEYSSRFFADADEERLGWVDFHCLRSIPAQFPVLTSLNIEMHGGIHPLWSAEYLVRTLAAWPDSYALREVCARGYSRKDARKASLLDGSTRVVFLC
ncbi:hypothetical protein AURDEDRAFT_185054 [Auricularia subglabra TFB-10046 SS5]|nr:hypothetical protein AURDEDRAFT_185054 [Auricularia subglabra TFB-10046 SS5]